MIMFLFDSLWSIKKKYYSIYNIEQYIILVCYQVMCFIALEKYMKHEIMASLIFFGCYIFVGRMTFCVATTMKIRNIVLWFVSQEVELKLSPIYV